jgi:hypothetical protein
MVGSAVVIKSPSKFKKHVTREIQEFLGYVFRDVNPQSPRTHIMDALKDINHRTGGIVHAWLRQRKGSPVGTIEIKISIPVDSWVLRVEPQDEGER